MLLIFEKLKYNLYQEKEACIMRKSTSILSVFIIAAVLLAASPASAHFGTITPSDDIVTQDDAKTLNLQVKFIHPMEMHYMEMVKPKQFGVVHNGKKTDLLNSLQATKGKSPDQKEKFTFWTTDYKIRRPGDYTFYRLKTYSSFITLKFA